MNQFYTTVKKLLLFAVGRTGTGNLEETFLKKINFSEFS